MRQAKPKLDRLLRQVEEMRVIEAKQSWSDNQTQQLSEVATRQVEL